MKTIGEVGYEKWRSLLPSHAAAGLPAWAQLPASAQAGWQEVANAIVAVANTVFTYHDADAE